jgi:uncharacterized membrane protein
MYIDSVIIFSLVVIAMIVFMMIYIGRYAKRHMTMDEQEAKARYKGTFAPIKRAK